MKKFIKNIKNLGAQMLSVLVNANKSLNQEPI